MPETTEAPDTTLEDAVAAAELPDDVTVAEDADAERLPERVRTLDEWLEREVHEAVLPSGAIVTLRIPNFAELLEAGRIPNALVPQVLKAANSNDDDDITEDKIIENQKFVRWLVSLAVVTPEISEEQVRRLPTEDTDLIYQIASRTRDIDAAGRHLGGLETLETFREVRGLGPSLASALGL